MNCCNKSLWLNIVYSELLEGTNMGVPGQLTLQGTVLQVGTRASRLLPHCGSAITLGLRSLGWSLYSYPADEERVKGRWEV